MNAVMKEEVRVQVNTKQLLNNSRFAFTNRSMILRELLQNGRRAGATRIKVSTPDEETLVVEDDGCGISDMQLLLTVAESGWDEATRESETPYGLGFLSAIYVAETIRVQSGNKVLAAATADLLDLKSVTIEVVDTAVAGTRIEVRGGQLRHVIANTVKMSPHGHYSLSKAVRGFPIPVVYEGVEVERTSALDNTFEPFRCGWIRLSLNRIAEDRLSPEIYLQGIQVKSGSYDGVTCHLDCSQFRGRMPDRDTLVEAEESFRSIKEAIDEFAREKLIQEKQRMNYEDFIRTYGAVCSKHAQFVDLLNDVDYVPASWFRDLTFITCKQEEQDTLKTESGLLTRAELEAGCVIAVDCDDVETGFMASVFAKAKGAFATDSGIHDPVGRLHCDHWLRGLVNNPDRSEFTLEIEDERGRASGYVGGYEAEVIACQAFILSHPTLGVVRVTEENLFTGNGEWEEEQEDGDAKPIDYGLVVMTTAVTDTAAQVSTFEVDDSYSEVEENAVRTALMRLYAIASQLDPSAVFEIELRGNGMGDLASSQCNGMSFIVTYNEHGRLISVVKQ